MKNSKTISRIPPQENNHLTQSNEAGDALNCEKHTVPLFLLSWFLRDISAPAPGSGSGCCTLYLCTAPSGHTGE